MLTIGHSHLVHDDKWISTRGGVHFYYHGFEGMTIVGGLYHDDWYDHRVGRALANRCMADFITAQCLEITRSLERSRVKCTLFGHANAEEAVSQAYVVCRPATQDDTAAATDQRVFHVWTSCFVGLICLFGADTAAIEDRLDAVEGKERAGTIYASLHHAALSATKSIGSVVHKAFMQKCLQHLVKKMEELLEPSYLQQLDARAHNAEADLFAIAASMDVQLGIGKQAGNCTTNSGMTTKQCSIPDVHRDRRRFPAADCALQWLLKPLLAYIRSKQPQLHALIQAIALLDMIACFARNAVSTHQASGHRRHHGAGWIVVGGMLHRWQLIDTKGIGSVTAEYAAIRPCDRLFFRNYLNCMFAGASAFVHQLQEMKFLLHSLDGRSLILLDEMERNTTFIEAVGLTAAFCKELIEHNLANYLLQTVQDSERKQIKYCYTITSDSHSSVDTDYGLLTAQHVHLPAELLSVARQFAQQLKQHATANTPMQVSTSSSKDPFADLLQLAAMHASSSQDKAQEASLRAQLAVLQSQFRSMFA
ncbi:hypothetical protein SYNPS1DRAFT_29176 [Syncephalis pseudoplumigaleata]|uniref:DNA mismatch repair proteins mutS family domain-containing protein n=1 Tax=Syncephalis pseudoplumigaleata TaxID=1712513 RepID=A0A4P9YYN0_9FUNG|nr:hypothetical protein SYNPS1DRAFT_29176 [Syncephalis pseudoplumigaleata]|eukprot:RKP25078.1 hypothetical protein SYNPS1DRAFT_29176 [Syncephalis pseudoplumigaleata]